MLWILIFYYIHSLYFCLLCFFFVSSLLTFRKKCSLVISETYNLQWITSFIVQLIPNVNFPMWNPHLPSKICVENFSNSKISHKKKNWKLQRCNKKKKRSFSHVFFCEFLVKWKEIEIKIMNFIKKFFLQCNEFEDVLPPLAHIALRSLPKNIYYWIVHYFKSNSLPSTICS